MHIQQGFMNALELNSFKEINEKNFQGKNGNVSKLRVKYKALKQEWSWITARIKNGSRLCPDKESRWFKHLNPVFCEANETIRLSSSTADTSFVNERNESQDESEGSSYSKSENPAENSEDETQTDKDTAPPAQKKENSCCSSRKIQVDTLK